MKLIPFVLGFFLLFATGLSQADDAVHLNSPIQSTLFNFVGKSVSIRLDSGEKVSGVLKAVGSHLVHVSQISGREFYDELIEIDAIAGVEFRRPK